MLKPQAIKLIARYEKKNLLFVRLLTRFYIHINRMMFCCYQSLFWHTLHGKHQHKKPTTINSNDNHLWIQPCNQEIGRDNDLVLS